MSESIVKRRWLAKTPPYGLRGVIHEGRATSATCLSVNGLTCSL